MFTLTPRQMAWRLAQDVPAAATIWLDAGLPREVATQLPASNMVVDLANDSRLHNHNALLVVSATQVAVNGDVVGVNGPALFPHALTSKLPTVFALLPYFAADGSCSLVSACTRPPHWHGIVTRVYTDLAVLELSAGRATVCELVEGITLLSLQMETPVELRVSPQLRILQAPALD